MKAASLSDREISAGFMLKARPLEEEKALARFFLSFGASLEFVFQASGISSASFMHHEDLK
jgi:hypothetical protein